MVYLEDCEFKKLGIVHKKLHWTALKLSAMLLSIDVFIFCYNIIVNFTFISSISSSFLKIEQMNGQIVFFAVW